jgi:hypothetical protein
VTSSRQNARTTGEPAPPQTSDPDAAWRQAQDTAERRKQRIHETAKRALAAALDETLFPDVSHPGKRRFLFALCELGNRARAAEAAQVHPTILYTPAWRNDAAFQAALEQCDEVAADIMESEAYRRAVDGVEKPTGWFKGEPGGFVREYSDLLMIFLLKGLRPDKYRDRMEMRGMMGRFEMGRLPDEVVARIARGEHPMAVLASVLKELPAGAPPAEDAEAQVS